MLGVSERTTDAGTPIPASGLGVPCREAQADGTPCTQMRADCADCDKATTGQPAATLFTPATLASHA